MQNTINKMYGMDAMFIVRLISAVSPCKYSTMNTLKQPIHKGGSTDDPSHYRPIAVVSVVAKVNYLPI